MKLRSGKLKKVPEKIIKNNQRQKNANDSPRAQALLPEQTFQPKPKANDQDEFNRLYR